MKKLSDKTPTKLAKATGASSKPLPEGFVVDDSPSEQIFIGGLPGRPPQKQPIPTNPTKATGAPPLRPGPKGFVEVEGDGRTAGEASQEIAGARVRNHRQICNSCSLATVLQGSPVAS